MKIETKYNINQTVFLLQENKSVSGTVHSISTYCLPDSLPSIEYFLRVGEVLEVVSYPEEKLFPSKQELINSL